MTLHLDLKATIGVDDAGAITGLAWPFGTPDRVGDVIEPGAFKGARTPIPMLFAHDPNDPVGVWTEAVEDRIGLRLKGRLLVDDVPRAREVRALVKSGAVGGLSIGLCLTLIHLVSIPVSNTSVNPARSTGPALFTNNGAIDQLWLFWLAPIVGAIIGAIIYNVLLSDE